jgi:putative thiamine transport system substrate-binding protein
VSPDIVYAQVQENIVYFHAWGGSPQVNSYIEWTAEQVKKRHNVKLVHVKLSNTSDSVNLVLSQKLGNGVRQRGTADLIWLNGENFASMAEHGLLQGDWATTLSNYALTNPNQNPDVSYDFGVPTLGRESPWGRASLLFYFNNEHIKNPPKNVDELLEWTISNPFRFTYPDIDDFIGISFVKYVLLATTSNENKSLHEKLFLPLKPAEFEKATAPLWRYLDALHPNLWRQGRFFVNENGWLKRLFDDEEILIGSTFSAGDVPASVDRFELPKSTRSYLMEDGSLSNVHFLAIPFNAPNSQGAKQVANFLLSPVAQAEKAKGHVWGDSTVLDLNVLNPDEKSLFELQDSHPSALEFSLGGKKLKEPHPSWITPLKNAWKERYGVN